MNQCENIQWYVKALALIAYMVWERWLGKTDKIKAGSTLDLIAAMMVAVICALIQRSKDVRGK